MTQGKLFNADLRAFVFAGRAVFTLRSTKTGARFTYRVSKAERDQTLYWVAVLTGPENTADYGYIGFIKGGRFYHGKGRSRIGADAPSVRAFAWFLQRVDSVPPELEVFHEGRCARCGRSLTVPESIESGFGPECRQRVA